MLLRRPWGPWNRVTEHWSMKKNNGKPPKISGCSNLERMSYIQAPWNMTPTLTFFLWGGEFLKTTNTCARLSITPHTLIILMTPCHIESELEWKLGRASFVVSTIFSVPIPAPALGALATPSVVAFLAFTHGPFATNLVWRWFFEFFETKKRTTTQQVKKKRHTTLYNYTPLVLETPKKKLKKTPVVFNSFLPLRFCF